MKLLSYLFAIFAITLNLYVGFHGEIDPFNILAGGILIGLNFCFLLIELT